MALLGGCYCYGVAMALLGICYGVARCCCGVMVLLHGCYGVARWLLWRC